MAEEILSPKLSATVNGESYYPESITILQGLNSITMAQVNGHAGVSDAAESSTPVSSEDVISRMSSVQAAIYSNRTSSDATASIQCAGDSLEVPGYIIRPNYAYNPWRVTNGVSIVGEASLVDGLNFSCYQTIATLQDSLPFGNDSANLAERIQGVADALKTYGYTVGIANEQNDQMKKAKESIHEANEAILPTFYEILGASEMGWDIIMSTPGYDKAARVSSINSRIAAILMSSEGGFFNTLIGLGEEFQCCYVPDDAVGYLKNRLELFSDAEELEVNEIEINLSAGGNMVGGMPPTSTVIVTAPSLRMMDSGTAPNSMLYTTWPDIAAAGGRFTKINAPGWLMSRLTNQEWTQAASIPSAERKVDVNATAEMIQKAKDRLTQSDSGNLSILSQWARSSYIWNSLGVCGATISVPLDLKITPGKVYKVKSLSGTSILTGLLYSARHTVSVTRESGSAVTELTFSHVEAGDFTLPDK